MEEIDESLLDEELLYALISGEEDLPGLENEADRLETAVAERKSFQSGQVAAGQEEKSGRIGSDTEEEKAVHQERRELLSSGRDALTVITKGTVVEGSICSDCSLEVLGTVLGNIECTGSLTVSGKVTGNLKAQEIYVDADRLEGNIFSEGSVKVGVGTVVIGDLTAASAVVAGAVKGKVDISGSLLLDSTAIIQGDIRVRSLQMEHGAVLDGYCSFCYASVEFENIFESE